MPYKRAIKQAISKAMEKWAKWVKVKVWGRLNWAEIARKETFKEWNIPTQTVRADIDYNEAEAKAAANLILTVETKLAEPQLDKTQSRNISNFNNPRTIAELSKMTPAIDWNKFIKDMGVTKELDTVYVLELKYELFRIRA